MTNEPSKSVRLLVEQFENKWHEGQRPDLADYFRSATGPGSDLRMFADRQSLLHCLVRVDMEFRWQLWQSDRTDPKDLCLESYANRLPELGRADSWPPDLIADEFRIRRRWGDSPDVEQALMRFPKRHDQLLSKLKQIEEEVAGSKVPLGTTPQQYVGMKFADGRYEVTAQIAVGGMGLALLARDSNLKCNVVIKMPHQHLLERDRTFEGRFLAEMKSLVDVCHPHIVKITDSGRSAMGPFAVLQYLSGGTLLNWTQRLHSARDTLVPWRELFIWLPSIADVLDYLHNKCRLIHRDVSPKNILFDSERRPYLSDFGLARVVSDSPSSTQVESVAGTPPYIAPETMNGRSPDGRADQFSLAMTAYYFLTATNPAKYDSRWPANEDSPPGREVLPVEVRAVFAKAMNADPKNRYLNCYEFTDALRNAWPVSNTIFGPESGDDSGVQAAGTDGAPVDTKNATHDATQGAPQRVEPATSPSASGKSRRLWALGALVCVVLIALVTLLNRPAATTIAPVVDSVKQDSTAIVGNWRNPESGLRMKFFPDGRLEEQRLLDTGRGTYQILPDKKIRIKTEGALGGLVPTGGEDVATYEINDKELTLGGRHGIALSIRFNREP